jgi:hypothetical protein
MNEETAGTVEQVPRRRGPPKVTLLPALPGRQPRLANLEGVRVEMARIYLEMKSGKRDSQEGSRLVYVLTQIAKVLELTEIERRLVTLEQRADSL